MTQVDATAPPQKHTSAIALVGALVGIYMLSQFFRNATGVIGPDLAKEFDLDATRLGLLSSIFFLSFAAAQIPLGLVIDRYGPKPALLATAALMIVASVFFARARDFTELASARALLGLGCCSFFMAPLTIYADRFSPAQFSTVTGVHLGGGSLGMLASTAPLAQLTAAVGWRAVFLGAAGLGLLATLVVAVAVRESPQAVARRRTRAETWSETVAGIARAIAVPGFWRLFFMQATASAAFIALLGLWAGPWLAQVYGMSLTERGSYTLILAASQIAALFFWGASDRFFGAYRQPTTIAALLAIAVIGAAALWPTPRSILPLFLGAYGFFIGFTPVLTAHGKSLFPPELTGRGLTLLNVGTMGGVFFAQIATGLAIETFGAQTIAGVRTYPPEAFRLVFGLIAAQLALALWFYRRAPDNHPRRIL